MQYDEAQRRETDYILQLPIVPPELPLSPIKLPNQGSFAAQCRHTSQSARARYRIRFQRVICALLGRLVLLCLDYTFHIGLLSPGSHFDEGWEGSTTCPDIADALSDNLELGPNLERLWRFSRGRREYCGLPDRSEEGTHS